MKLDRTNKLMDECLLKLDKVGDVDSEKLGNLLRSEVIERNGYIELVDSSNPDECIVIEDTKGTEDLENHIHLSDYIDNERGLILLKAGLIVSNNIVEKLKSNFPHDIFNVIISYDLYNEDSLNDCVVRFHKLRENNKNLFPNNLEGFEKDAVGVISISS